MTLILSCLTPNHVIQVSDRRLSRERSGAIEVVEEETVKAVVLSNRIAFAYSGRSRLGLKPIDHWLVDVLQPVANVGLHVVFKTIVDGAQHALRSQAIRTRELSVSFAGAGWAHLSDKSWRPIMWAASNITPNSPTGGYHFWQRTFRLDPPHLFRLMPLGQTIDPEILERAGDAIRDSVRNESGPGTLAVILVSTIRVVASTNETVGTNLLIASLPRAAFDSETPPPWMTSPLDVASPLALDPYMPMALEVSTEAGASLQLPHLVYADMTFRDMEVSDKPLPPPKPRR